MKRLFNDLGGGHSDLTTLGRADDVQVLKEEDRGYRHDGKSFGGAPVLSMDGGSR